MTSRPSAMPSGKMPNPAEKESRMPANDLLSSVLLHASMVSQNPRHVVANIALQVAVSAMICLWIRLIEQLSPSWSVMAG